MGEDYHQERAGAQSGLGNSYNSILPQIQGNTAALIPQLAQAQLDATQKTQGAYNQLNLEQLQKYGLDLAKQGQQITDSNAQAGAATNLKQILGAGGDTARAAYALNRETNPDYYTAQDAASKGAASAVNAINLNGLSPGEAAAVERSTNQSNQGTGNLGLNNNTNAIANAMNFGGAFNSKVGLMNSAVNSASGAANSAAGNGGFNGVATAFGQPNPSTGSNFGTGTFNGTNPSTNSGIANNAIGFGNSLLGNITSGNNALIGANAQTGAAQISSNSPASYLGATCCFIFLEAYKGNIPEHVRVNRNKCYELNHDIATGYRRMAKRLVPAMHSSSLVRFLVWHCMVSPMTQHSGFISGIPKHKKQQFITNFWLKLWAWLGKGKSEDSYAMTWSYPGRRTA